MTDVTRRQFLRNASIGAAAAGLLAVGGPALVTEHRDGRSDAGGLSANEEQEATRRLGRLRPRG